MGRVPTALLPAFSFFWVRAVRGAVALTNTLKDWWAHLDSNQGQRGYEPRVLTDWTIGPDIAFLTRVGKHSAHIFFPSTPVRNSGIALSNTLPLNYGRFRLHWLRSLILSRRSCHQHRLQVFHSIQSVVMDKSYPLITWAPLTLVEAPLALPWRVLASLPN